MDNQYNQPGAGWPQQGTGQQGMNPPYGQEGMPAQGYTQPGTPYNGYAPQQGGYQQPYMPGDYQQPYGAQMGYTAQQPYANQGDFTAQQPYTSQPVWTGQTGYQQPYTQEGYEHHFDHTQGMMMEEERPAGFPVQQQKTVRPRLRLTAFHVAIIVAALGFMGWYIYTTFAPETARYGTIASGNLSALHSGDCLIVRNEAPYDAESVTTIEYVAQEGSAVNRNDTICYVYASGYSTREVKTLQDFRSQIRDYQKDLIETESTYDAKMNRYTSEVMTRVREVRALVSGERGSLSNQEKLLGAAVDTRQMYLKQKYASDQRYSRLYDDEMSQSQRIDSWTKTSTAATDGLVSFYSDGYEYGLNGTTYLSFEPHEVRSMINGKKPETSSAQKGKTTIYRLVKDNEWYVLFLSNDTEWNPVKGQVYELQLERFDDVPVTAEVVSFTRSGGELLVRLKVTDPVKPVLYMRTCEGVLGENMSTLMVNERAIHVQDGMTGVVVVEGQTESFIPVNVIHYADGYAFFQAIQQGLLFENMTVRLF